MKKAWSAVAAAAAVALSTSAAAQVVTLDFEGVGDEASINDFYSGGTDSLGNSGTNYGVSFGSNSLALREENPEANFSGEPSPSTIMFFLTGSAVLNYAPGFSDGFSFWFTTTSFAGQVSVYDGLNATGNLLGTISLAALGAGPDAANPFSNWSIGALSFEGLARSIDFGGTVNQVGYDDITFGSVTPGGGDNGGPVPAIPEPSTYALMLAGLAGVGFMARRRRQPDA